MNLLPQRIALRYLFARKSHNVINMISAVGLVGMAIGTAALIAILSVFNGFDHLVSSALGDYSPEMRIIPSAGKTFTPDASLLEWLSSCEEVESVSQTLEEQVFLSFEGTQSLARIKGVDSVAEHSSRLAAHITDGGWELHRNGRPMAVAGSGLAYRLGASPRFFTPIDIHYPEKGSNISMTNPQASLRSVHIKLGGVVSVNAELDSKLLLVPLETVRELLDCGSEVSALEIRTKEGVKLSAFRRKVQEHLGDSFRVQDSYMQNESLFRMMRYEKLAIYLILLFVVLIIAFNIYSSLTMLIIEKEPDRQTLLALGMEAGQTRAIFRWEGLLVSLLGMAAGIVLGIVLVLLQQRFGFVKMPGNYIVDSYPVVLRLSDILWTILGVSAIGSVIAFIPSRKL